MAIIYRKTDRVKIEVDDLVISICPLGHHEKNKIQSLLVGGNVDSLMAGATLALKSAIKAVKGLKLQDGEDYQLEFENGELTDDALSELMNVECNSKITAICLQLMDGIPKEFINPDTKEVIDGVRIIRQGDSEKKA